MKMKGLRKLTCLAVVTAFLAAGAAELGTVYATDATETVIVNSVEDSQSTPWVEAESTTEATTEAPTEANSLTVAAKKNYPYAFDASDSLNSKIQFNIEGLVTVYNNNEEKPHYDETTGNWAFSTDKATKKPVAGLEIKKVTIGSDKKTVTFSVEATQQFISSVNGKQTLYVVYNNTEISKVPFTITRTADAFGTKADDKNATKIITTNGKNIFSCDNTANSSVKTLTVNAKYGKTKVDAVGTIKSNHITSVVVANGVTTINKGALLKTNLPTLQAVYLPDSITTIDEGAIDTSVTVYCSSKVAELVKTSGKTDPTDINTLAVSVTSGTDVTVDLTKMSINGTENKLISIEAKNSTIKADDVKWMICKPGTLSTSTAATFKDKKYDKVTSVTLTSLKANGAFNGNVDIVAVSKSSGKVYARGTIFITPALASKWKEGAKAQYASDTVTIEEGKTSKIPYALADGNDKTLVYKITDSSTDKDCISITNGTIKAIKPGTATVEISALRPAQNKEGQSLASKTITVTVTAKKTQTIKASVSSITLKKGDTTPQEFTVYANPVSDKTVEGVEIKPVSTDPKLVITAVSNATGSDGKYTIQNGAAKFKVALKDETSVVNDVISIKYNNKEVKVRVSTKDDWTTPNKFTQPSNKKDINIPVGAMHKLGLSLPTTARADYDVFIKDSKKGYNNVTGLTNVGDVLTAKAVGTYEVYAASKQVRKLMIALPGNVTVNGDSNSSNSVTIGTVNYHIFDVPVAVSDTYTVNVYDPASTVAFKTKSTNAKVESIIQGGYLIKQEEANYDCVKSFKTGTKTTLEYPDVLSGTENIIWTVSKPGAVNIKVNEAKDGTPKHLELAFNMPGKYTVTGTTEYSKMKVKFTVQVDAPTVAEWNAATKDKANEIKVKKISAADATVCENVADAITMNKGESINLGLSIGELLNAGGKVTFKSSDTTRKIATVSASGVVKAVGAGKAEITITLAPSNAKKTDTFTAVEKKITVTVQ